MAYIVTHLNPRLENWSILMKKQRVNEECNWADFQSRNFIVTKRIQAEAG